MDGGSNQDTYTAFAGLPSYGKRYRAQPEGLFRAQHGLTHLPHVLKELREAAR